MLFSVHYILLNILEVLALAKSRGYLMKDDVQ